MTKHEIEILKEGYQRKCLAEMHCRRRNDSEGAAEAESKRIDYLYTAMKLLEVGKRQGSAHPLIDEWEAEVGFGGEEGER